MALITTLAALEDHDLNMVEPVDEAENLAEATEVESSLIDAQENDEEIGDMESDVEVADDAMDAMESLIESLEEAVERGGMDRHEAKLYNLHRKHIYKTLGYTLESHQMVSTESFDGTSSRLQMTKIALEEEKNMFVKFWEAIVRFIKQMAAKVTDFVVGLFSTVQALQGRAQTLLKQLKDKDAKYDGKLTKDQQKKYGKIFRGPGFEDRVAPLGLVVSDTFADVGKINSGAGFKIFLKIAQTGAQVFSKTAETSNKVGSQDDTTFKSSSTSTSYSTTKPDDRVTHTEHKAENGTTYYEIVNKVEREITVYNDSIKEVGTLGGFVDDTETQKKVASAWKKDGENKDGEHKYGVFLKCYDGRAVVTHIGDQSLGDGDDKQTIKKLDLGFINIGDFKEEDSKLLDEKLQGDKDNAEKILNQIIKGSNDLRKCSDSVKKFNKDYQAEVDKMEKFTKSIPQHAASFCRKVGNGIKSVFTTSRAMSQWFKYVCSILKDVLNVISIRLSNAPGDDDDKEEDKKEDKK